MRRWLSLLAPLIAPLAGAAAQAHAFTHADTLRGSNTPQRAWWDVSFYDLHVSVDPRDSTIRGWNAITYRVLQPSQMLQVDLQQPLGVDSIVQEGRRLAVRRDGDAFFVTLVARQRAGERNTVTVYYHGKPVVARRTPRAGGRPPTRAPAPPCGGPTRTTSPTSPTASASPSPRRTPCSMSRTAGCAA